MELAKQPSVLLLSLLKDKKIKNLTELTAGFEELLRRISRGAFQPKGLIWLDSVEYVIKELRQRRFLALVDEESYKFQMTSLGQRFFDKNKTEMEKRLSIEL